MSAYASSNAEMAHLLGLGHLFSDPDPEPDWEPWPGLTEEAAFTVAQRLEPGFARALMAEFDAVPTHDMAREQRLCRDALHDALDPPCSAPPVRRKTDAPKLSVLTLTYNHAAYIAECMESVIAQQTAAPIRHIIADDASDDGTRDIVLDYAARYPHIVPVLQRQRSFGLRALFDMARTEYVALCEGDDYFTDPEKLRIQTEFLDAHQDCALCFHPVRVVYEDEPDKERVYPPPDALPRGVRPFYYLGDLLKHNFIQTNSVMYRWRFRNGLPSWFRTDLVPGDWYWHLLHAETGKIGFINTTMSVYRRHKQALYYLADKDRIRHRATVAMRELEVYDVLNKHFGGKYEASLLPLADGVFSACLLHGRRTADKQGKELLDRLCEAYPDFAAHYLRSLERTRHD